MISHSSLVPSRSILLRVLVVFATLFGLITIFGAGGVLFGGAAISGAAGYYVSFVVWFNFLAGFAYITAGFGLWVQRPWSVWLSVGIALAIMTVGGAFAGHVWAGGDYEARTFWALAFRFVIWVLIAMLGYREITGSLPWSRPR